MRFSMTAMTVLFRATLLLLFSFVIMSCGSSYHDDRPDDLYAPTFQKIPPTVTFGFLEQNIFKNKCAVCHNEANHTTKANGLKIESYLEYRSESQLGQLIEEVESGNMPESPIPALSKIEIDAIKKWASQGFPQ